MGREWNYLFGPVPSRRLGLSLGVDIVPLKTCTQNCVYCQLGINGTVTLERKEYVPIDDVLKELEEFAEAGVEADYITLSGSGEPTLNIRLGELIDGIKRLTKIPVAILTNGTLLIDSQVRAECAKADLVLPSLDAGDEQTFAKLNRPHEGIDFGGFVEGLVDFRKGYSGQIWLEVFFCEGLNTSEEQIENIKAIVERVGPDKVQLNTAVRPTVENVIRVEATRLEEIASCFGDRAEVIADFSKVRERAKIEANIDNVISMLKRRPCTVDDICRVLGVSGFEAEKYVCLLEDDGRVIREVRGGKEFFSAK